LNLRKLIGMITFNSCKIAGDVEIDRLKRMRTSSNKQNGS